MTANRIDAKEPLVINTSEIDEVADYIYSSLRHGQHYQLEYLKMSMREGKILMFGRKVHVLP